MSYQNIYSENQLTKEQIIEKLTNILRTKFSSSTININYNPHYLDKSVAYYQRTLDFFDVETIEKVKQAYIELARKNNKFLLIDGENIFYKMNPNQIMDIIYELYYNYNYPYIVIFCQAHSISKGKKLYDLQQFLDANRDFDIRIFTDDLYYTKFKSHHPPPYQFEQPPLVPSETECDDILLIACYSYLRSQYKDVKVLSGDNMRWSNATVIPVKDRITGYGKKTKKIKPKPKKQRTRTKPKPKKQRTRTKPKPKKQKNITKPKKPKKIA